MLQEEEMKGCKKLFCFWKGETLLGARLFYVLLYLVPCSGGWGKPEQQNKTHLPNFSPKQNLLSYRLKKTPLIFAFQNKEYLECSGKQCFQSPESISPSQTRLCSQGISVCTATPAGHVLLCSHLTNRKEAQDNAQHKVRDSALPSRGWMEPGTISRGAPETNWTRSRNPAVWGQLAPASQPSETPFSTGTMKLVLED